MVPEPVVEEVEEEQAMAASWGCATGRRCGRGEEPEPAPTTTEDEVEAEPAMVVVPLVEDVEDAEPKQVQVQPMVYVWVPLPKPARVKPPPVVPWSSNQPRARGCATRTGCQQHNHGQGDRRLQDQCMGHHHRHHQGHHQPLLTWQRHPPGACRQS